MYSIFFFFSAGEKGNVGLPGEPGVDGVAGPQGPQGLPGIPVCMTTLSVDITKRVGFFMWLVCGKFFLAPIFFIY